MNLLRGSSLNNYFKHAIRFLIRDWQSGQLKLLTLALIIAVASVSTVSFFADRLKRVFESQATELLAADLVILSSEPISKKFEQQAKKMRLSVARQASFPSVVLANNKTQLVNIKAVSQQYPLRGQLKTSKIAYGKAQASSSLPAQGEAWVESRLVQILNLKIGDSIQVGNSKLKFTNILAYEPDRGSEFFNIAPRLLMRHSDLASTQLIQAGSRIKYRFLIAGAITSVDAYRQWALKNISKLESIQTLRDARPELRVAIERGERYLSLASLVSVLLAGVAIAIASRRFVVTHLDHCAIYKCMGASQKFVNRIYFWQFTLLGLMTSIIGLLIAWLSQAFLAWIVQDYIKQALPTPSLSPIFSGILLGMGTLYLFSLPYIYQLKNTPPLRVIRKDLAPPTPGFNSIYISLIILLLLFIFQQFGDWRLTSRILLISIITIAVLALVSALLLKFIKYFKRSSGIAWRYGITNIVRRSQASNIQIIGFGISLMALLLLSIVRHDVLQQWQASLPENAPNQFVINIQNSQIEELKHYLSNKKFDQLTFYPMVRGRLIAVNNRAIGPSNYDSARAKRLVTREFNLSWANKLQTRNQIIAGQWWSTNSANTNEFSVEIGIAQLLGIKLNDKLTFIISGQPVQAVVTSLRKVNWDTLRPNFFVLGKPGLLDNYPRTWIFSFYLPETQKDFLTDLVKRFPNITIIDVDIVVKQIKNIMDKAVLGIEFMFVFTLIAGFVVMLAAIEASQEARIREGAVIRALGGRKQLLINSYFIEFAVIGLIAGFLAALGATAAAYFISTAILNMEFELNPVWWLVGMLGGGISIGIMGLIGSYKLLKKPPSESLRNLSQ